MKTHTAKSVCRKLAFSALAVTLFLPSLVTAGAMVIEQDDFSLGFGTRIQFRAEYDQVSGPDGLQWQRDFMVRRSRVKMNGKMYDAKYALEWRIDSTDRAGGSPSIGLENGYIKFPIAGSLGIQAGLYDQPFSRDRLTSDSKQLGVDRGIVSNFLSSFGLADNAVGFHLYGKSSEGLVQYRIGLFDNRTIASALQDVPMVVGRLDLNLGSTENVFRDCHFGDDSWYSVGVNGTYHGKLDDGTGVDDGENALLGADGMIDIPFADGYRYFVRAEGNSLWQTSPGADNSIRTVAWMAGAGVLLFDQQIQPNVRFDQIFFDDAVGGGDRNTTSVGVNFYRKGHNLKLQADVSFESGTGEPIDGGRFQAQIDY